MGTGSPRTRGGSRVAWAGRPAVALAAVAVVSIALSWQFVRDPSRAVPALDVAWYQWRAELLQVSDPETLITATGAQRSLAGGYRVAEPVLAALMRTVGGVGPATPTVVLSVLLRVLAALGLAAFAWRHRRDPPLFYLTLAVAPPLFLLQRFFGFLDNFVALAMVAGVLLLLDAVRVSWVARLSAAALLVMGGLSHPTTVVLFLASYGAVVGYRLVRDRSVDRAVREHAPFVLTAGSAAVLIAVVWLGGAWGPSAGFGEAAVPPPQPTSYFVDRSLNVLGNMTPWALFPLIAVGAASLLVALRRRPEPFAELALAWTLPLAGMLGFLVGAAYPYFRFFNATLAPLLLAALGLVVLVRMAWRLRGSARALLPVVAVGAALLVGVWWVRGLSAWNGADTWLTPEVREPLAAADAYLEAEPGLGAVYVVDAQPGTIVPYGKYKEYANAIAAGLAGERIERAEVFFGRIEDLMAGRPTAIGDPQYDALSRDSAEEALAAMERHGRNVVLFVPMAFNESSTNPDTLGDGCIDGTCGATVGRSELLVLPAGEAVLGSPGALAAARAAAAEARAFDADPPGPFEDLGGTMLAVLRLALLLLLPGWLLLRGIPGWSGIEALALAPVLGIAAVTTVGVAATTVLRVPLTAGVGWGVWGVALVLGVGAAWIGRRPGMRVNDPAGGGGRRLRRPHRPRAGPGARPPRP